MITSDPRPMPPLLGEVNQALRSLSRDRTFTLFSILALVLGLALNGAFLVMGRTFLLRSAPVADPANLLEVKDVSGASMESAKGSTTAYQQLHDLPWFQGIGMVTTPGTQTWNGPEASLPVEVAQASGDYLPVLGVRPFLGRTFLPRETAPGGTPSALVSHAFWRNRLGSRPQAVGSLLSLNGKPYTIVGVLPPGFEGQALDQRVEVLTALVPARVPPTMPIRITATVLVLLCSTLLCLKDLRNQVAIPLGLGLQGRYLLRPTPEGMGLKGADLKPLLPGLRDQVRLVPGVHAVGLCRGGPIRVPDLSDGQREWVIGSQDLPRILGMTLKAGRFLEPGDEGQPRALVSEDLARSMWPTESALGQTIHASTDIEVVGVLGSTRLWGPTEEPGKFAFLSSSTEDANFHMPVVNLLLQADPGARPRIAAAARSVLKGIPFHLDSLEELRDEKLAQPRRLLLLASTLGSLALLLSLTGIYGFSAHLAEARKRELGIRAALGAGPARILVRVAGDALAPLVPGLAAGALLALAMARVLVHQGEAFPRLDGQILGIASLVLALASVLAVLVPTRHAVKVEPIEALRQDA